MPDGQSAGLGRELISRAFAKNGAAHRCIIASSDTRAQALYLKAGVYPQFSIYNFERAPEVVAFNSDLVAAALEVSQAAIEGLNALDHAVLGRTREADHAWLLRDRQGYLYYRDGAPVGFGYVGAKGCGPFLVLDEADMPAVLAHAESTGAALGLERFDLWVPAINRAAIDHLLQRKFQLSQSYLQFMVDKPFGQFDKYIFTSPIFFL